MPLDRKLFTPGMGTEHIAPLLYSLVRMVRPRRVLEVGLGYTSPFLAQALMDNVSEVERDKKILTGSQIDQKRQSVLLPEYFEEDYSPSLIAIDDMSLKGSTAPKVQDVLKCLDLDSFVDVHNGDFRGYSEKLNPQQLPFDFIWFDCGGALEYIEFLHEYWPLINENHGLLLLHYTYWYAEVSDEEGAAYQAHFLAPIANEIKRQQLDSSHESAFEVLSLLEPHKSRQGSLTMVRKLSIHSLCRNEDFQEAMVGITGRQVPPMPKL